MTARRKLTDPPEPFKPGGRFRSLHGSVNHIIRTVERVGGGRIWISGTHVMAWCGETGLAPDEINVIPSACHEDPKKPICSKCAKKTARPPQAYIARVIGSEDEAAALPPNTIATKSHCPRCLPFIAVRTGGPERPWEIEQRSVPHSEVVGWFALLPVEVQEEARVVWADGSDLTRDLAEAREIVKLAPYWEGPAFAEVRLVTAWAPAPKTREPRLPSGAAALAVAPGPSDGEEVEAMQVCDSCGTGINPVTGECRCSD